MHWPRFPLRRDAAGYTALLRLAGHGDVASVKRLLQVGADTEARNLVRLDRLQWLCRPHVPRTHTKAPSLRHVHVYAHPASTQHGNTAMMLAAEKNRYLVIEALLAAHADPRAKNYARARHANRYRPHTARPPNACTLRPWQCGLALN